jgi:hypothetical protein
MGAAIAFLLAYAINSHSLAWLFTDEIGRPLSEPLLRFWTWRLPLTFGLASIAIALFASLRGTTGLRQVAAVTAIALIAAAALTWHLYATTTRRSLREIAATLVIRQVSEPPTFLSFFANNSDPAGVATNDPAVVAEFAGCYDVGGYQGHVRERIVGKPERVRLSPDPIDSGWRFPAHPTLELEPQGAMAEFWYVENGSGVLIWSAGLSGRSMMIRPNGHGGFVAISGSGDDITPMRWSHVNVQRVPCD